MALRSLEIEALLTVQMAVMYDLVMQALVRAQPVDQIPMYECAGGMAARLLPTCAAQVEALAKLRRGGEQFVNVPHVHPGAQAVVGKVVTNAAGASAAARWAAARQSASGTVAIGTAWKRRSRSRTCAS